MKCVNCKSIPIVVGPSLRSVVLSVHTHVRKTVFPKALGALGGMVGARAALVQPGHSVNKCGTVEQYVRLQTALFLSPFFYT